jgi:hypothetical protein
VRGASLIDEVESDLYQRLPVPERWIPADHAAAINSAREFPRAPLRSIEIADFVRVYGTPTFLASPKSNKDLSYLVYEMADGYKLLVRGYASRVGRAAVFSPRSSIVETGNPRGSF